MHKRRLSASVEVLRRHFLHQLCPEAIQTVTMEEIATLTLATRPDGASAKNAMDGIILGR